MSNYVVVTYATHSAGLFEKLIHNDFNTPITVLGWGEPWVSFKQKFVAMVAFLRTLPDDTVVVFLDGWDTVLHRHPKGAIEHFKATNADVLFSSDRTASSAINFINSTVFQNTCSDINQKQINSGMYMGYAKAIESVLSHVMYMYPDEADDQLMINKECRRLSSTMNFQVDVDKKVFENIFFCLKGLSTKNHTEPYFISYPGSGGTDTFELQTFVKRSTRDAGAYSKQILTTLRLKYSNQLIFLLLGIIFSLVFIRNRRCLSVKKRT